MPSVVEESYDVCVVGAGHAGCEAALACARLGLETIVFTVSTLIDETLRMLNTYANGEIFLCDFYPLCK